jgi:hypothetical protein
MGQQLELFPVKKQEVGTQLKLFPEYEKKIDNWRAGMDQYRKYIQVQQDKKKELIENFVKEYSKII